MSSHSVHEFNEVVRPVQKLVFKRPYIIIIANASAHLVYRFHCFPEIMNKFKRIAGYTFKYEPFFVRRGGGGGGGGGGAYFRYFTVMVIYHASMAVGGLALHDVIIINIIYMNLYNNPAANHGFLPQSDRPYILCAYQ